jgi:alkanesulfonate monooxygenase SsuD/methylene tetrahydromethanopterin reductase-like flavin-dependent oxidoreductase (luciferase family)
VDIEDLKSSLEQAPKMQQQLRFGIITLQNLPWSELAEQWQYIEQLGFDSAWVADHFVNPYRPGQDWFDGWTTLAALAATTHRIRVGTLVSSITLHNPAFLARRALTVDHISSGRLELGIGAGGATLDHTMMGGAVWPAQERARRFREFVEIVDLMLSNERTSFKGAYYRVNEAIMRPAPIQKPRPPLALAAHGTTALKVVAEYADSWVSFGGFDTSAREALDLTRHRGEILDEYCAEVGRDPNSISRSFLVGFTPDTPFDSLQAFHEFIGRYREAGINEFTFYWMSGDDHPNVAGQTQGRRITDRKTLELIATEALPLLR